MSSNAIPDYQLEDLRIVTSPRELRAMADPLRSTILDLVLERAATVAELVAAVGRPKSTVAHHVGVLLAAELVKVVRTRRVRAIDERFYGRTARIFYVGRIAPDQVTVVPNYLPTAAAESAAISLSKCTASPANVSAASGEKGVASISYPPSV